MQGIKPALNRATKAQRERGGELMWRVVVYDPMTRRQIEKLACGLADARRKRDELSAAVAATSRAETECLAPAGVEAAVVDRDRADMHGIKPDLDRNTKVQRVVGAELMWRVIVYNPNLGKQVERSARGILEARRIRADLRANVLKPVWKAVVADANSMTVRQWAQHFLEYYATGDDGEPRPATSMENALQRLELYVLPHIADRTITSVTLTELEDMIAGLTRLDGRPLAKSSRESVAATVKTVWAMAKRRGVILGENVAEDLHTNWGGSAASERRLIKPSLMAVDRLADAMGDLGDVVYLFAFTGMRWEEASGAWLSDVSWEDRLLGCSRTAPVVRGKRVPPAPGARMKSRRARRDILIVDEAVGPLQRLIARAQCKPPDSEPVLVTGERGRGPLHYRTWRNKLKQAQAATGVPYTAHELRHVYASILIDAGLSDERVARYMGHSSGLYTRRLYGHWFPQDSRADAEHLSASIAALRQRESAVAERFQLRSEE